MSRSDLTKKYSNQEKVTMTFHFPKVIYKKIKDVSEFYNIPKQKLINGIIDNEYWKQNLPTLILSDSKQYLELMNAINQIKSDIGIIGKTELENNMFTREYLKIKFKQLQNIDEVPSKEETKIDTIIENQDQILKEIRELQNKLDENINPTLEKLWLKTNDRNRNYTF